MISIIAAIAENNCIGKDGTLPWNLPEDMQHFRDLTIGKPVIMGRKTWESLPDRFRPLPQRTNIVITRQNTYAVPANVFVYDTLESAIAAQDEAPEIMIIGGAQIYELGMPIANRLYITKVHQTVLGDAFFPDIDLSIWQLSECHDREGFSFLTYNRI